jgi:Protein of unknown function (DUF1592)/Protein of unknown function (DUF1588)/Protein of unknown function (DUF1595)/Protein of unknown function (DUF1585)/Protein of unknown function (DUF1587)
LIIAMRAFKSRWDGVSHSSFQLTGFFSVLALLVSCGGRAAHGNGGGEHETGGGETSSAGSAAAEGGASAIAGASDDGGSPAGDTCAPGRAPLRRLRRSEYLNTVAALFGDVSQISAQLPAELRHFPTGMLAEAQWIDSETTIAYFELSKELAARATNDPKALAELAPCAATAAPGALSACARTTIEAFASKAFRRSPTASEVDELLALHDSIRASGGTFAQATAGVISAILQAPDFLYRIEWGEGGGSRPDATQLTGEEMATRLSYLFWGAPPDEALRSAAKSGALSDAAGVLTQAKRLLDDPRAHDALAVFFDNLLQLYRLPDMHRSDPAYDPTLGSQLQQATQRFLEAQIFDQKASWPSVLTANQVFVNGPLSALYGIEGISGDALREVSLDSSQRLGLLTQAGPLVASFDGDVTNPTVRGNELMKSVLCREVPAEPLGIEFPPAADIPGAIRQRLEAVTSEPTCVPCHHDMDQLGYAFENFDTLGRYRNQENGFPIDAKVEVSGVGPTDGPVDLVRKLSALPETQACLAQRFAEFSLGKALADDPGGACLKQDLSRRFEAAGYNVRQLLLALTQTDAFLYLPKEP